MIEPFALILRLEAYVDAKSAKDSFVLFADDNGEVCITSLQVGELFLGKFCYRA